MAFALVLHFMELLEFYRLKPWQTISWVAERSHLGYPSAVMLMLRSWAFSSWQENRNAFHMQKVIAKAKDTNALIQASPENQPYRNEAEIRNLFARLAIPISQLESYDSCYLVRI